MRRAEGRRRTGRVLGAVAGRRAEAAGGVLLLLIGGFILYEHTLAPVA